MAYLVNRLNVWSVYQLLHLLFIQELCCVWTLKLFQLLILLLFILVHPKYARLILFYNIHFVISAVLCRHLSSFLYAHATLHPALLGIEIRSHVLAAVREFVFKTSLEAFVEMIVGRFLRKEALSLALINDLTYQYAIHANASTSTKVHDAWIGVAFLKE